MENLSLPSVLADVADQVKDAFEQPVTRVGVSPIGVWEEVVDDATAADNGGSDVQTLAQVLAAHPNAAPLYVAGRGTHLAVRLKYDDGCDPNVDPVAEVFGVDPNGAVEKLRNLNGATDGTLATDAGDENDDDAEDGTWAYSTPDDGAVFDMRGAAWVVVAVKTAFTVSAGSDTSAIEAKVF